MDELPDTEDMIWRRIDKNLDAQSVLRLRMLVLNESLSG
jgi:hypothetical protein